MSFPESPRSRHRIPWYILKVLLAVALLSVVVSKIRLEDARTVLQQASWIWLPVYILFFFTNTWIVARRYYTLLNREVAFPKVLRVAVLQTVLANLVVNVAGFASYVAMLRGQYQMGVGRGVSSLVAARFLDLVVWLPCLFLATWILWPQVARIHGLLVVVLSGMAMVVLIFVLVLLYRKKFLHFLRRVLELTGLSRVVLVEKATAVMDSLAEEEPRRWQTLIGPLLGCSVLVMLFNCGGFFCTLRLFGVILSPWPIIFISILTMMLALLPIQVLGGLGVTDVSLLFLFGLFNIGEHTIVPVIIGARLLFYSLNLLLLVLYFPLTYWLGVEEAS